MTWILLSASLGMQANACISESAEIEPGEAINYSRQGRIYLLCHVSIQVNSNIIIFGLGVVYG